MNIPYLLELKTACMRVATRWKGDTFLSEAMKDIPASAIPMVLHRILEAEENNDDHWHLTLDAPPKTQALHASFVAVFSLMVWEECRENLCPLLPTDEYDRLDAMPLPPFSHSSIPGLVETYCPNLYPYLSLVLGPHDWNACTVRTLAGEMRNAEYLNDVVPLPKMDMD